MVVVAYGKKQGVVFTRAEKCGGVECTALKYGDYCCKEEKDVFFMAGWMGLKGYT